MKYTLDSWNNLQIQRQHAATYKLNFSFQIGLSSLGTVFVLFLVLPTWTVTYGSLVPVLSLAINPWAQMTAITETCTKYQTHNSQCNTGANTSDICFSWTCCHPMQHIKTIWCLLNRIDMNAKPLSSTERESRTILLRFCVTAVNIDIVFLPMVYVIKGQQISFLDYKHCCKVYQVHIHSTLGDTNQ